VIVFVRRGDEVLVVHRSPAQGAYWHSVSGGVEDGETDAEAAVRELREETGLEARLTALFNVYAGFDDPRVRAVLILYTAEIVGGRLVPGDDATDARWFPIARPPRAIAFAAHRRALEQFRARPEATSTPRRGARSRGGRV